jgi:hypothetical protein
MSMTLAHACALITTAFRSKQTALTHSLTYSMEWRLTLPFRSAEHTYCYSLSHALTFTYSSNVKWLFIIVEQRNKKRKNSSRHAHTHTIIIVRHRLCIYIYVYDILISFKHQIMHIEWIVVFRLNMKHTRTRDKKRSWGFWICCTSCKEKEEKKKRQWWQRVRVLLPFITL